VTRAEISRGRAATPLPLLASCRISLYEISRDQSLRQTMDSRLLDILCCPITRRPMTFANEAMLLQINSAIEAGKIRNHGGEQLAEPLAAALVTVEGDLVYPLQDDIPVLLEEACIHWAAFKN